MVLARLDVSVHTSYVLEYLQLYRILGCEAR
jgi:hypothetical protein